MLNKIVIGYDSREDIAYQVCKYSILSKTKLPIRVIPLKQQILRDEGIYKRDWFFNEHGQRIDKSDKKPFSTEFSFTRFLIPFLANTGWVLFCDCDQLFRTDVSELIPLLDEKYAVMVVKHNYSPKEKIKMDNCIQERYYRKNWSSFVAWNLDHPAHAKLSIKAVNSAPGSWLHQFKWLDDDEIGALPEEWNWLEGHSSKDIIPKNIHYTRGGPWWKEYKDTDYADEWRKCYKEIYGYDIIY